MRKLILALGATTLLAAPTTAVAADYKVTGGKLDWTHVNYFASGDPLRTPIRFTISIFVPASAHGFSIRTPNSTSSSTRSRGPAIRKSASRCYTRRDVS